MIHIAELELGGFITDNYYHEMVGEMIKQRDSIIVSIAGDKAIVSGVIIAGSPEVATEGVVVYNNKVYSFIGGNVQDDVTIKRIAIDRPNSAQILSPAYYKDVIQFGNDGLETFSFSELKRTDNLSTIKGVLSQVPSETKVGLSRPATSQEIEGGAKSDVFISPSNFPSSVLKQLKSDSYTIGNIPATDHNVTISFSDIGTSNYIIIGNLVSLSNDPQGDNDIVWVYYDKTATGFSISFREITGGTKNYKFDYVIVAM